MHCFDPGSVLRLFCRAYQIALIMLMAVPIRSYAKEKLHVELIAIGGRSTLNYAQLTYFGPPISVAIDYVNKVYNESLKVTLKYLFDDMPWTNMAPSEYTGRLAAQWYYRERNPSRLSALIIAGATVTPDLSYILQQWNVLFLTLMVATLSTTDRTANPAWISTARLNNPAMTMLFCEVLLKYNWSTFMIILDVASAEVYRVYADLLVKDLFKRMGRALLLRKLNVTSRYDFLPLLTDIRAHTRIVFLFGSGGMVRDFLIAAYNESMTNGDYVYMAFEVLDNEKRYGRMDWEYHDKKDKIAHQAFQSLLILRPADIYDIPKKDLSDAFLTHSQRDFNLTYGIEDLPYLHMLSAYSAVTTLAEVMDTLWRNGHQHPYQNGTYLAQQFFNRTFQSDASSTYIDDKGGRQMDLYLWRCDESGRQTKFLYKRAAGNAPVIEMYQIQHWVNGPWPPPNEPFCGYNNNRPVCGKTFSAVAQSVPIVAVVCVAIIVVAVRQIRRIKKKILTTWWIIDQSQLEFVRASSPFVTSWQSNLERKSTDAQTVHQYQILSEKFVSVKLNGIHVIMELAEKTTKEITLDRLASHPSFLSDLNKGVQFIHSSALSYHGSLCGLYCHVDKSFTLKICGLVNSRLTTAIHGSKGEGTCMAAYLPSCGKRETLSVVFNQNVDMYAVGIVLWELMTQRMVLSLDSLEQSSATGPGCLQEHQEVLAQCWQEDVNGRPSVKQLRENLAKKSVTFSFGPTELKFIDKVLYRLAGYTRELENEVCIRTKSMVNEMNRCNEIVAQILPRWVATQIRAGNPVPAEFFECVTLMFTQISGFASLVKDHVPKVIIDVIGESEITVDRLIGAFADAIYKVEIVDDCFLVAGGLQLKSSDRHAQLIAELAIVIQQSTPQPFTQYGLQFQSGMHSGPCAAGIAGFRRLRYCLFGDTVNTASRMCSYGEPSRTQMSEFTAMMIDKTGLFETERRGVISIKGKDVMTTYWLNGYKKNGSDS